MREVEDIKSEASRSGAVAKVGGQDIHNDAEMAGPCSQARQEKMQPDILPGHRPEGPGHHVPLLREERAAIPAV